MRVDSVAPLLLVTICYFSILSVSSYPTTTPVSYTTIKPTRSSRARARQSIPSPHGPHRHNSNRVQQRIDKLRLPGKKGAAYVLYPGGDQAAISRILLLRAYWNFSWGLQKVPEQPSSVEFVPMQWGGPPIGTLEDRLNTYVVPLINSGQVQRLLAFNEPDHTDQANMSPEAAISLWPSLQRLGIPLCSPSCATDLPIANDNWLELFMNQVNASGYRVDYVGVHWYGSPSVKGFQSYMQTIYAKYNRPLLVTEFGVADWGANATIPNRYSQAQVLSFMKAVLPWMEAQSWIYGYIWFSFSPTSAQGRSSALFDSTGSLTACGMYYQSVTTENPQGNQTIGVTTQPPQ